LTTEDLHLFRFGFTSPSELAWLDAHPESDLGEFSEAVFIRALSATDAETVGEEFAEAFVRALYGHESYSWRELQFASWIEKDPEIIAWATENHIPCIESPAEIESVAKILSQRTAP